MKFADESRPKPPILYKIERGTNDIKIHCKYSPENKKELCKVYIEYAPVSYDDYSDILFVKNSKKSDNEMKNDDIKKDDTFKWKTIGEPKSFKENININAFNNFVAEAESKAHKPNMFNVNFGAKFWENKKVNKILHKTFESKTEIVDAKNRVVNDIKNGINLFNKGIKEFKGRKFSFAKNTSNNVKTRSNKRQKTNNFGFRKMDMNISKNIWGALENADIFSKKTFKINDLKQNTPYIFRVKIKTSNHAKYSLYSNTIITRTKDWVLNYKPSWGLNFKSNHRKSGIECIFEPNLGTFQVPLNIEITKKFVKSFDMKTLRLQFIIKDYGTGVFIGFEEKNKKKNKKNKNFSSGWVNNNNGNSYGGWGSNTSSQVWGYSTFLGITLFILFWSLIMCIDIYLYINVRWFIWAKINQNNGGSKGYNCI